jgi:hypothetical protein
MSSALPILRIPSDEGDQPFVSGGVLCALFRDGPPYDAAGHRAEQGEKGAARSSRRPGDPTRCSQLVSG